MRRSLVLILPLLSLSHLHLACDSSDGDCEDLLALTFVDSDGNPVAGYSGTLILEDGRQIPFGCDATGRSTVDDTDVRVFCWSEDVQSLVTFDIRIPDGQTVQLIAQSADGTRAIDLVFPPEYRIVSRCETAERQIVLHRF